MAIDYRRYEALKSKGWMTQGVRTIDGQAWAGFVNTADRAAASRGTGSQQRQWALVPMLPPLIIKKLVAAPPKPGPKVPISPTDKVTNNPNYQYSGPSKLFTPERDRGQPSTMPGGGAFAKWGETYFMNNHLDASDRARKLGRGVYVGASTRSAFGSAS